MGVSGDPEAANNGLFYIHSDHLGSTSVLTKYSDGYIVNSSLTRYTPFGGYRAGGPSQITDRAFTGQKENMALGLYYYNARYYAPSLGRFLSADTLVPDPQNPQSLNRFSYTRNNPLNYLDPTGHRDIDTDSGGGGIITGDKAFMIYALTIAAVASQNPEVREFVEDIPKGAQNVWDSWMAAMSGDDSNANAQQSQNLGEIAGHTASSPGDFDPNENEKWHTGDPIDKVDASGNYPKWETVRDRYWRNRAATAQPDDFSPQNLGRMRNGLGPRARIIVRINDTGEITEQVVTKELHHINGRGIPNPHAASNLQELWPWEHAKIDPNRYLGYEFLGYK